jgi:hypothetical protein
MSAGAGAGGRAVGVDWQASVSTLRIVARPGRTWRNRIVMVTLAVIVEHERKRDRHEELAPMTRAAPPPALALAGKDRYAAEH